MKKRIVSYLLAFSLVIISSFPPFASALSPRPLDAPRFNLASGRGTEADPYLVTAAEELFIIAEAINSGTSARGVYFRLERDIDLGGQAWTPIGLDASRPFDGVFDGGGHTLSGLNIETDAEYAGLFGCSTGTIRSLAIKDSIIRGSGSVGAVCGFGAAESCVNFAEVHGKTRVGGIVGEGAAYGCENRGDISGISEVGGLVGRGEAWQSTNFGSVYGKTSAGGISGLGTQNECENLGSVHELSPTQEKADHSVAKFIRWALTHIDPASIPTNARLFLPAESCGTQPWEYLYGSVRVPTSQNTLDYFYNNNYTKSMRRHQYDDITSDWNRSTYATDCQGLLDAWLTYEDGENTDINVQMNYQYWCTDKGSTSEITRPYVIGEAVFHYSRRTGRMTHIGFICGFDEDGKALAVEARGVSFGVVVTRVEDRGWQYRGLMTNKFNYDASMPSAVIQPCEGSNEAIRKFPVKQLKPDASAQKAIWDGSIASGFAGGSGTEQDPYLITNGSELMYLSRAVKNGNTFFGKHFRMTNDIRLNDTSDWQAWDILYGPENEFEPIGSYTRATDFKPFRGNFDGGGHTVYGLYYSTSQLAFHGIFGYVGPNPSGCIRNLNLAESYLCAVNNMGGIVGYLEDYGSILNCRNSATITSGLWVGGIVGYIKNTTAETRIEGCMNAGKVYGTSDTGGIVGFADTSCTIINCAGIGLAKSSDRTGGIVGCAKGTVVSECKNDGIVRGTEQIGGIAGKAVDSTIEKCYNAYSLSTKYRTGGILGIAENTAVINCFNTGNMTLLENAGGIVGQISGGRLENCYSIGNVNARRNAGAALGKYLSMPGISHVYVLRGCCEGGNPYGIEREGHEFADESGYSGFDFAEIWHIDSQTEYPFAELRAAAYTSSNIPEYEPFIPPQSPTPEPTPTPIPTPTLHPQPTSTPTPEPTSTPTPEPTAEATTEPDPTPSPTPTTIPTLHPQPTPQPSETPAPEPSEPPAPEPLLGDVDGSGSVTLADAIAMLRFAMGLITENELADVMLGDMDGNGIISISDSILLLRMTLGL